MATTAQQEPQEPPIDVLMLIATQSFTGESLVQDTLVEQFWNAGLTVETKLVDEAFTQTGMITGMNELNVKRDINQQRDTVTSHNKQDSTTKK